MTAKRYLKAAAERHTVYRGNDRLGARLHGVNHFRQHGVGCKLAELGDVRAARKQPARAPDHDRLHRGIGLRIRSEEHTSELQSLMRNSYAVLCLKKKNN